MRGFLTFIYGVVILTVIYLTIRMFYSVNYTPGTTTLYNSPVTQKLFPSDTKKLFPTWGYNKAGMYDGQAFKYGQGSFWPESGPGYKPSKYGYGGPSPDGGERPTLPIPDTTDVGFWGYTPQPERNVPLDIYDNSSQHVEYLTPIGHWND
jgi:hypothetical protein